MSVEDVQPEGTVRKALLQLSRQRVPAVLQPGNVWVVDNAISDDEETHAALMTCYMRGWVEPLHHALPRGKLTADGRLPEGALFKDEVTLYRVTPAGWAIINHAQGWTVFSVVVSVLSFAIAAVSLVIALVQK